MNSILLLSNNIEYKKQLQDICNHLHFDLFEANSVVDFIFEVEKKDYQTLIIDGKPDDEYLKLIQILKKIRPRIPIVFITSVDNKVELQKIYNEGVFYLYITPLNKQILIEVINSSIVYKMKEDNLINQFII